MQLSRVSARSFQSGKDSECPPRDDDDDARESHCIKADGLQRCHVSRVPLFYRPGGVASSFSVPLSPLSTQPSTRSLPSTLFSSSLLRALLCPSSLPERSPSSLSFCPSIQRHIPFFIRSSGYEPSCLDSSSFLLYLFSLPAAPTHPIFLLFSSFALSSDSSPRLSFCPAV